MNLKIQLALWSLLAIPAGVILFFRLTVGWIVSHQQNMLKEEAQHTMAYNDDIIQDMLFLRNIVWLVAIVLVFVLNVFVAQKRISFENGHTRSFLFFYLTYLGMSIFSIVVFSLIYLSTVKLF